MSDEKLGLEPAFPLDGIYAADALRANNQGVSKRLWIATQLTASVYPVIKGLENATTDQYNKAVVSVCYNLTDELLRQENK